jgi:hypothetical protein
MLKIHVIQPNYLQLQHFEIFCRWIWEKKYFDGIIFFDSRGTKTLQEILSDRENISHSMQAHLDEGTDPWGVKVERVEMWIFFN